MRVKDLTDLWNALSKIPGGYDYSGVCSVQLCFPLKAGGELRFMYSDEGEDDEDDLIVDHYGGEIPPGVTGPVKSTGEAQIRYALKPYRDKDAPTYRHPRLEEHYGEYGDVCMNTGQFDAGECWKCQIKRLRQERDDCYKVALLRRN